MLARLRSQPRLSETVQFTNNVSSDKAEVMLPTTATLVEVPESQSSYSSPIPTTTSFPQTIQQARPADVQCSLPSQVHQVHSHNPNLFPYYVPPSTVRQPPQHSAAPRSQAPVDGQMGWYTTQNVPPQSGVHNPLPHQSGFQPIQVQQPAQSWSSYPPPVVFLPAADAVPAPGYYTSPPGWIKTAPAHSGPNTGSSSTTYRATQSTASRPPVTTHILPPNLPSLVPASQVQVPLHGVPALSAKIPSGQPLPTRSLPKPAEFQTRPVSTPVSKPVAISELQRPQKPPQQPQPQYQPQQSRLQPQQLPQPPQQPQHHSQLLQTQPQRLPQPPFQHHQQSQELPSQRPLQPPQTHRQTPSQSADRVPSTSVSQPHSQPSQVRDSLPPHPTIMQEQARQGAPRADQATFIKLFQVAVQRGILQLKAFFLQARASGISDEWFRAAINSLPRGVWESIMAQDKQSGTLDAPSSTNVPQQQVPTIPGRNAPVATAQPSPTAAPLIQTTPATQQVAKPSTSTDGRITVAAPGQTSGSYAVQLQYYAQQATKSALSARGANVSANPPGNIPPTNKALATPTRDLPQAQINVRTPKDANKSTLARDILRSLGKIVPKPCQEMGGEPTDKAKDREGDQLPEVNLAQPVSHTPSPKPPVVPPATSFVLANSPSIPSAKPNVEAELQHVASPNPSTARSVSKAEREQAAVIGPIMIDLTLEDESDDEKGPESTFPIQTSASTATSPQPVFPTNTNTTNHTPLLENLSLEEPVDVAADCDNADVRMYNPPLSLATEENMESELLYPLLGSAEPVSPSFEPLPREASEHPLDETDLEMINDEDNNIPSLKRHTVDAELLIPRIRKRRKVYVLIPPAPLYVKKAIKKMKERAMGKDIDSDSDGVGEDEECMRAFLASTDI
ncbi:hypothetical protein OG21DRAFT_882513 [Imleria badia]|nr:hypothetical protein OG21DRAFT_882513 [Imleria badia]